MVDRLAEKYQIAVDTKKHRALIGKGVIEGQKVLLVKPQTYMNASGTAISAAADFYKIPAENVIVICDDITREPGKMRIRRSGSAGGHKGLKSIIAFLDSENFPRIRLGVGEKPNPDYDLASWVLGKFSADDKKLLNTCFEKTYNAIELIISGDIEGAMRLCN